MHAEEHAPENLCTMQDLGVTPTSAYACMHGARRVCLDMQMPMSTTALRVRLLLLNDDFRRRALICHAAAGASSVNALPDGRCKI